jgi:hypothetical protein
MRAVVIPVEGPVVPLDLPDEGSALEVLQAAVGGMIEALPFPYRDGDKASVYVNEDGKYTCLDDEGNVEVNLRATAMMKPGVGLFPGDFVAGPLVIAGFDPSTGEHIDLASALYDALLSWSNRDSQSLKKVLAERPGPEGGLMQDQDDAGQQALPVQDARRERLVSARGYTQDVVVSWLQKSIRRGLIDDAIFTVTELDESGWGEYAWSRLMVIVSEDCGLAAPGLAVEVRALYENWQSLRKRRRGRSSGRATSQGAERLPLIHATLLLARAPKSQIVVNACIWHTHLAENGIRSKEPAGWVIDRHTREGKRRGRGWAHFMDGSSLLADRETGELSSEPVLADPYRDKARSVLVKEPTSVLSREHDDPQQKGPRE